MCQGHKNVPIRIWDGLRHTCQEHKTDQNKNFGENLTLETDIDKKSFIVLIISTSFIKCNVLPTNSAQTIKNLLTEYVGSPITSEWFHS